MCLHEAADYNAYIGVALVPGGSSQDLVVISLNLLMPLGIPHAVRGAHLMRLACSKGAAVC